MRYTEHTTLPAWEPVKIDATGNITNDSGVPVWSNRNPPPPIGSRVNITVNGIGMATVQRYFTQGGFLGLKVLVDTWPGSLAKQNGDDRTGHVFGAEIE